MPQAPSRFLSTQDRLKHGCERERQIADALRDQIGLPICDASQFEDFEKKIDRWIVYPDKRIGLQIKYRETGEDLLFEVFDRFFDWDHVNNKIGRDMIGSPDAYAVLLSDRKTVVIVPTQMAKDAITILEHGARVRWTVKTDRVSTFRHFINGSRLELKVQPDPFDHRKKMIAYIPADFFVKEKQAETYRLLLPKNWK